MLGMKRGALAVGAMLLIGLGDVAAVDSVEVLGEGEDAEPGFSVLPTA